MTKMKVRKKLVCVCVALLTGLSLWGQVEPSATGGYDDSESLMMTPPPVIGLSYPSIMLDSERHNYLRGGVLFTTAHDDNVLPGITANPVSDTIYTVLPNINLNIRTPRNSLSLLYGAGFSFYDPTDTLNAINQNGVFEEQYRVTRHLAVSIEDSFQHNSSPFSAPYVLSGGGTQVIIAPYANQVSNTTIGNAAYQYSRNAMIGFMGNFGVANFTSTSQSGGLYNSKGEGAGGFYARRMTPQQYIGVAYQYQHSATTLVESATDIHNVTGYYTFYLTRRISFSLVGGTEHYSSGLSGHSAIGGWIPSGTVTALAQTHEVNLQASYSHSITTGQGLIGAYGMDDVTSAVGWQATRRVRLGAEGQYQKLENLTPEVGSFNLNGRTGSGKGLIEYRFSDHLVIEADYTRFHREYPGISAAGGDPNSNRFSASVQYQFTKALGR